MSEQAEVLLPSSAASHGFFRLDLSRNDALGFTLFALPYLAMLYFFSEVDVYHLHFFSKQYSLIYNVFRCAFIVYFFWTMYFTGILALYGIDRSSPQSLSFAERIALGFFIGAVLWQALMFVLGYLSLYYRPVAIILFSPFVLSSYLLVKPTFAEITTLSSDTLKDHGTLFKTIAAAGAICFAVILVLLLLVKGLYPSGGHDYWVHYFFFLTTALKTHGIWPNDVWYHYFFMKGVGWYFLGMLLTDPLAPSLINYCFVVAAAFALFALIDGSRPGTWWPWAVILLYVFFYIKNTPAQYIAQAVDAWGEFSKPHEINATFFVVIVWISAAIIRDQPNIRWPFVWAAGFCCVGATYVSQPTAFIIGAFFLLLIVYAAVLRYWRLAVIFFGLGCVTAIALLSLLPINYFTTGMPLYELMNELWAITDVTRLERVGWIFDVLYETCTREVMAQRAGSINALTIGFLADVFRLNLLTPLVFYKTGLVLLSLSAAVLLLRGRLGEVRCWLTAETILIFVIATLLFAVVVGQTQAISFFRYTSFNLPLVASLAALLWLSFSGLIKNYTIRFGLDYAAPLAVTALTVFTFWSANAATLQPVIANAERFATASYSIGDAFTHQEGWPGRLPWGAMYPGAVGAWKAVGPGPRIWSLHVHSYCMAPDCRIENVTSFVMSHRMLEVMLGPADRAKDILSSEGLNYFLFSTQLGITDWLPISELFSPAHIAQYLGIKWTDGTTYLLTWLGPGVEPLTAEWIAKYANQVNSSRVASWSNLHTISKFQNLYDQLYRQPPPHWGRDVVLPWDKKGCG